MRHKKRHLRKKTNNLLYKFKADTREATLTFNLKLELVFEKTCKRSRSRKSIVNISKRLSQLIKIEEQYLLKPQCKQIQYIILLRLLSIETCIGYLRQDDYSLFVIRKTIYTPVIRKTIFFVAANKMVNFIITLFNLNIQVVSHLPLFYLMAKYILLQTDSKIF